MKFPSASMLLNATFLFAFWFPFIHWIKNSLWIIFICLILDNYRHLEQVLNLNYIYFFLLLHQGQFHITKVCLLPSTLCWLIRENQKWDGPFPLVTGTQGTNTNRKKKSMEIFQLNKWYLFSQMHYNLGNITTHFPNKNVFYGMGTWGAQLSNYLTLHLSSGLDLRVVNSSSALCSMLGIKPTWRKKE